MDTGTVRGIVVIVLIVAFVTLTIWAYSKRRKPGFDEAANLPFADQDAPMSHAASARRDTGDRDT